MPGAREGGLKFHNMLEFEHEMKAPVFAKENPRRNERRRRLVELGGPKRLPEILAERTEVVEESGPDFCELWCNEPGSEETPVDVNVSAVPLPASWLLLVGALTGLFGVGRLRGNRSG